MPAVHLDRLTPSTSAPLLRWRDHLCARFGRVCALLRLAHDGRVPF